MDPRAVYCRDNRPRFLSFHCGLRLVGYLNLPRILMHKHALSKKVSV